MGRLVIRQLLAGRDIGRGNPVAAQMQNFAYLIGDAERRRCVLVDPAWAVDDILDLVEAEGYTLDGVLATHYHPDHVGGHMFGFDVEGVARIMERSPCKVHTHRREAEGLRQVTGLDASDLVLHDSGDRVKVGDIDITLLHTPGHTPGSLCFKVGRALVAGDTLFLQGCGRVDLPGGDPDEMYYSLTQRLASLPGDTILYPGHAYSGASADMDTVRRTNPYLQVPDLETWRRFMR